MVLVTQQQQLHTEQMHFGSQAVGTMHALVSEVGCSTAPNANPVFVSLYCMVRAILVKYAQHFFSVQHLLKPVYIYSSISPLPLLPSATGK